jgi:hypothetical protein
MHYSRIVATERLRVNISMNIVWIVLSVAIAGVIAKWAAERHAQAHLGFVSHQWLADHRLSQVSDPQG